VSGLDILCLGEPLVEFNREPDGRWLQGFGGDVSNVAVAAARQGARSGIATRLGADGFGDALMGLWAEEGVDSRVVVRDPGAQTGIYFVDHGPEGHRFTYYRRHSAASRMAPGDPPLALLDETAVLHVSAISQAISESARAAVSAAIESARAAGVRVSYDSNLRLSLWPLDQARAVIEPTAALADILLPGLDDARQLTGLQAPEAIVDHYLAAGAGLVALTLGRDGVLLGTPESVTRLPGHAVESVDATGAGDAFDGSFLARLVAGDTPAAAAAYANAAAALSTTGYGAVAPIPRPDQVRALLG
jgi:2-dehydro-3-deoxygluconokinase